MIWISSNQRRGFTIVELLIVIVVIAILAAISITAYNGIQTRAENTKTISGMNTYVKALKSYAASKGKLPDPSGYGYVYSCLGPTGSICGAVANNTTCSGIGRALGLAGFTQHMTTEPDGVLKTMPELSKQSMSCNGSGERAGGALYVSYDQGTTATIYYFLRGNADCGSPGGLSATSSGVVSDAKLCIATMTSS